ncbi:tripartite tricarboxylate transporter substrate-binding protein [Acidovorax sp.]|uniref:tripartite tricarboxylate transporter substrate-binding protein n=1 Tax=Acidovorax sp. TaxID=1872122 RepID=UPI003D0394A8
MPHPYPFALSRRRCLQAALLALPLLVAAGAAQAQTYSGPIRMLVGYPPGGPADTTARIVAEKLAMQLGQPVLVDNKPGAGGQIAAQALKAAPADGSVIFMSNTHTVAMVPLTMKAPGFAPATDFRPLGAVANFELALAVHPKTGAANLAELGTWFAAHRSEASIGVPAPASAPEFIAGEVARQLKADIVPVAYRGATPMVTDLLAGQIAAGVSGISDFLQYQKSSRLRIVAVSRTTPLLPGVPSFAQAGLASLDATSDFLGLYAPAGLNEATVARYNTALNQVVALPEVVAKLQANAMAPAAGTPGEQALRLAQVSRALAALVAQSGFVPQ